MSDKIPLTLNSSGKLQRIQAADWVAIAAGGTGANTAPGALEALGAYPANNPNNYINTAEAIGSVLTGYTPGAGTVTATDTVISSIEKLDGNINVLLNDTVNALSAASSAEASAMTAVAAATSLSSALAAFQTVFLGRFATDPLLDGNGNPLMVGAEYFNTTEQKLRLYTSTGWQDYAATIQTDVTAAALSAANAAASASYAASNASAVTTSATTASTSATNASASATAAAASASNAAASASTITSLISTATDAATTATSALATFQSIRLGSLANDPSTDGNGNPLQIGSEYFNTTEQKLKLYTSSGWQDYDITAQIAANNASLAAESILTTVNSITTSVSEATTSASNAATSANAAANSATEAATSMDAVLSVASNISNYQESVEEATALSIIFGSGSGTDPTTTNNIIDLESDVQDATALSIIFAQPTVVKKIRYAAPEIPSGLINGSNLTYTLIHTPINYSLNYYVNGSFQTLGVDYTLSGNIITRMIPLNGATASDTADTHSVSMYNY